MIVVGLLSGTSMDGLDVAVAEIEIAGGVVRLTPLGAHTTPWSPRLRDQIGRASCRERVSKQV